MFKSAEDRYQKDKHDLYMFFMYGIAAIVGFIVLMLAWHIGASIMRNSRTAKIEALQAQTAMYQAQAAAMPPGGGAWPPRGFTGGGRFVPLQPVGAV